MALHALKLPEVAQPPTGNDAVAPERVGRPATARGKATRRHILLAAELEFGKRGYFRTSVASIVSRAAVGVGTFYIYFQSKDDVLCALVRDLSSRLRRHLNHAVTKGDASANVQQLCLEAYMQFQARHPGLDRIVSAADMVDEHLFRQYHEILAQGLRLEWQLHSELGRTGPDKALVAGLWIGRFLRLWQQFHGAVEYQPAVPRN